MVLMEMKDRIVGRVFEDRKVGRYELVMMSYTELLVLGVVCAGVAEGECVVGVGLERYGSWEGYDKNRYIWKGVGLGKKEESRGRVLLAKLTPAKNIAANQ